MIIKGRLDPRDALRMLAEEGMATCCWLGGCACLELRWMEALTGFQPSPGDLGIDGDRDEERKWGNRMGDEEEEQEEPRQHFWKMPHSHLAQVEGRGGGRGKEGMAGRGEGRGAGGKAQLEKCLHLSVGAQV